MISYTAKENEIKQILFNSEPYTYYCHDCKIKYYKLIIDLESIKKYLKIEVENESDNINTNYIISFSNKDEECLEREQLSQGIINTQMWLTKNQIKNNNNYFYITCSSFNCNYKLTIISYDIIQINFNVEFTLYITENNKNIEVNIYSDLSPINQNFDFVTIWALGYKNIDSKINNDYEYEYEKYPSNNIFKIKNSFGKNIFDFKFNLSCEIGDIINIGSNINYLYNYNKLNINHHSIKGFLSKEFSNEDCYGISEYTDDFYLNGIIYNKIAEIYYKNKNKEEIINSINIINNGTFTHKINKNSDKSYFCMRFPKEEKYDINEIFYSLQLTDLNKLEKRINLYNEKLNGEIYQKIISKGEILFLNAIPNYYNAKEYTFGIISQFGSIEIYFDECINFPLCDYYDVEKLKEINQITNINGNSFYKISKNKFNIFDNWKSPINKNQNILIVKCVDNNECGFSTLFYTDKNKINFIEEQSISKFIIKGEEDNFKIDYSNDINIYRINIELMVFSGDVIINYISNSNIKKNFFINKIIYTIEINSFDLMISNEVIFSVLSLKNSFYNIKYKLIRNDKDIQINKFEQGISYLITIEQEKYLEKNSYNIIPFYYFRNNLPVLVSFYSLNCKFSINSIIFDKQGTKIYKEIKSYDQYYQDINNDNNYEYILYINEIDSSNYNNKMCMIYSSFLELDYDKERQLNDKQIIISEGEQKEIVFNIDFKKIEYLYPHSNSKNDIIIKFNLIDIAKYSVTIFFSNQKNSEINYIQTGNDLIYIDNNEWKDFCNENEICPIIIQIKLISTFLNKEPKLIISVNSVQDSFPCYLQKNIFNNDFLLGNNWKYFYTDLGKNEEGEIIINFRRDMAKIFTKIIKKNPVEPEIDADWRKIYKFPKENTQLLKYNEYNNKIIITKNETKFCQEGCFLLLSLQNSIASEISPNFYFDYREHPFNILLHITKTEESFVDIPIINLPLNEYIIGNLDSNIYEYYFIYFNRDSNKIIIDFQSKFVNFYINIGNKKPNNNSYNFCYENYKGDQDIIFEITKNEILEIYQRQNIFIPNENSLEGLSITIGLNTNKKNILYSNFYSLKINLPFSEELEIYEVYSDQKVLCKTKLTKENENRCLFIIFYLGIDSINQLLLYPLIQDHSSYDMFANFISQEKYENFDFSYIKAKIPNSESYYSTKKSKLDYIYIEHGEQNDMYLLVSVITQNPTIVELLSSFYTKDIKISPKLGVYHLFGIKNNHFLFEFPTYNDITINIESINGEGEIYFEKEKNKKLLLNGNNDKISITYNNDNKYEESFTNLYIISKSQEKNKLNGIFPGFLFYMNYILRTTKFNLDEILINKSTKIVYNNTDFPIYIYSLITKLDKDTNIFINLYELIGDKYFNFTNEKPFEIKASLIDESKIMKYKTNPELIANEYFDYNGIYDPMINTGYILIKKEQLSSKYVNNLNRAIIIIKIVKNKNYSGIGNFNRIKLIASLNQDNNNIPISPNNYQYGKLSLSIAKHIYKLKTEKSKKYLRIHFSSNSLNINYTINIKPEISENILFEEYNCEVLNGKSIITFNSEPEKNSFIYLIIYHNNKKSETEKLNNYVFKYENSDNTNNFKIYKPKISKIELNVNQNNDKFDYIFSFYPISEYQNYDISYYIKFVNKVDYIKGESNNSIAITESKSYIQEFNNYELKNDKIFLNISKNIKIDYRYIQIIARIKDKNIIDYICYENIYIKEYESIFIKDSKYGQIIDIIISIIIVILFFALCYFSYKYIQNKRNIASEIEKIPYSDLLRKETELEELNS